ncbi:MAG: MFS transporter [Clostridia bacterium]|nr:MFS transporter [Clostridia bacterium]
MVTFLLCIIYAAFIGLGLPDGLLGAAWPVMHLDMNASLASAGIISFIITCGTVISSLLTDRLTRRFSPAVVTVFSTLLTAGALFAFSAATDFTHLCLLALPYGLGAGAIDATLNNVVALHFSAKHMSWLHCFWGVGASIGPYIMGACLAGSRGWSGGYLVVGILQAALTVAQFLTKPIWKKALPSHAEEQRSSASIGLRQAVKIRGVKAILVAFFAYCSAEMTAMLWTSSYLTEYRGVNENTAATLASLFYIGMMVGRFANGFLAEHFSDKTLIRAGIAVLTVGLTMTLFPTSAALPAMIGILIVGLGCAPVYPCIIHSTPILFGRENSQAIIGIEMACAYAGSCLMPPLFGLLGEQISMGLFPVFILVFIVILLITIEHANRVCRDRSKEITT